MKNDQNAINWERSRVVRVFAALVLIIAAVLKLNGLYLDPFSGETFLSTPHVQLATVFVQLFLGGWLLSGVSPRSAWLSTILLFVLFALASLYLWLAAQRSCNCFGQLHVHPLYVFFFDLSMVAALLFSPPPPRKHSSIATWRDYPVTWHFLH